MASTTDEQEFHRALKILELSDTKDLTEEDVQKRWRELSRKVHPDGGGSTYFQKEVNNARDLLIAWIRAGRPPFGTSSASNGTKPNPQQGASTRSKSSWVQNLGKLAGALSACLVLYFASKLGGNAVPELIGSFLGGVFWAWIISLFVKRLRPIYLPVGAVLGLIVVFSTGSASLSKARDDELISQSISRYQSDMKGLNPEQRKRKLQQNIAAVTPLGAMARLVQRLDDIEARRYPSLLNPILNSNLPANQISLRHLQELRDATVRAADSSRSLLADYDTNFSDAAKPLSADLLNVGLSDRIVGRYTDALRSGLLSSRQRDVGAMQEAFNVNKDFFDFLIESFPRFSVDRNGSFIFQQNADLERFNILSEAVLKAVNKNADTAK